MFQRISFKLESLLAMIQYRKKITANNIKYISKSKINKILKKENLETKNIILHNALAKYNKKYYEETFYYLDNLKRIIKRHNISLLIKENQFLKILEERIFAKERNLKRLDTNYELIKSEYLYAKYREANSYFGNNFLKKLSHGNLLITNKRIIIETGDVIHDYEFYFSRIKDFSYEKFGFVFTYGKERILLRIHDSITLNNTIKQIQRKIW